MSPVARGCGLAVAALCGIGAASRADEADVALADAPGREVVYANCLSCHSADYIAMNAPFLDEKGWRATVTKMRNVMRAPISAEDAETIVRYLSANYGPR